MNYDLAMMALEGLSRSPLRVSSAGSEVTIEGTAASFKELARLCLLLGGEGVAADEEVALSGGMHLEGGASLRLRRR